MGFATAIDLLVARIETYTPTVDASVRFRRVDEPRAGAYRHFAIQEDAELEPNADTHPNPYATAVVIDVYYDRITERFRQWKAVATDAEELFARVVYSNSDQWGLASNVSVIFNGLSIKEIENRLVISLGIKLVYNV